MLSDLTLHLLIGMNRWTGYAWFHPNDNFGPWTSAGRTSSIVPLEPLGNAWLMKGMATLGSRVTAWFSTDGARIWCLLKLCFMRLNLNTLSWCNHHNLRHINDINDRELRLFTRESTAREAATTKSRRADAKNYCKKKSPPKNTTQNNPLNVTWAFTFRCAALCFEWQVPSFTFLAGEDLTVVICWWITVIAYCFFWSAI